MARNEEMERRCLNWARWKAGDGQGGLGWGSGSGGWQSAGADRSGYREAKVPTLDAEAEQTNRAIETLDVSMQRTVTVYYLGTGTMEQRCSHLQISRATIYLRVDRAHELLAAWLREIEAKARNERERLALLLASARPQGDIDASTLRRPRRRGKSVAKGSFKE